MKSQFSIIAPSTFMYLEPKSNCDVTDQLLYGTVIYVSERHGENYVFCKTEYGYGGYIKLGSFAEKKVCRDSKKFTVISNFCPVNSYPEHRTSPKITLPKGSVITGKITTRKNGFIGIDDGNEIIFVSENHISDFSFTKCRLDESERRRQIVKTALSYLNSPYMWAGKTPAGIDCSGLCFMAYTMCGAGIYRDAEFDGRYLRKISFSMLKPADLIYYSGHVAMYLGHGMYIHASGTHGKVTINSFDKNSRLFFPKLYGNHLCCGQSLLFNKV